MTWCREDDAGQWGFWCARHKFINTIPDVTDVSEAVGLYNVYSISLLNVFFETIKQQVTDMLKEIAPAAADEAHDKKAADYAKSHPNPDAGSGSDTADFGFRNEIVSVNWKGQDMLAAVSRMNSMEEPEPRYLFASWVTPDMQSSAAKMVKEKVSQDVFKGQHVPDPDREDGERIVTIGDYSGLALVTARKGKLRFKEWVNDHDTEGARARGQMQNGGIRHVDQKEVDHFVAPLPATPSSTEDP